MSRLAPLCSLACHLSTGAPLPERDRAALAEGLARYFDGEPIDVALGLKPASGQGDPRAEAARVERDRLLCEAAREVFPDLDQTAQARELHRRWTRYAASGWPRERALATPPAHREGTLEARLWAMMRLRDHVRRERTIRATLAANPPCSVPPPAPSLGL